MVELENLCKSLGGRPILKGVNLRVKKGETLVIVGSSGTGKSVTLQHIVGLMTPDKGRVVIDGKNLTEARGRSLEELRTKFGVLFQSGALINWMNIFDNIALPLYEHTKLSDKEIADIVHEKLRLVGLNDVDKKMPSEISGGMKKRAGLARAIVRNPEILLYDEPTSGLDPVLSRSIDKLILNLQEELDVTSIVVTHDLKSAFTVGNRVALLHHGTVAECCSPEEFKNSSNPMVRRFIDAQFAEVSGV